MWRSVVVFGAGVGVATWFMLPVGSGPEAVVAGVGLAIAAVTSGVVRQKGYGGLALCAVLVVFGLSWAVPNRPGIEPARLTTKGLAAIFSVRLDGVSDGDAQAA